LIIEQEREREREEGKGCDSISLALTGKNGNDKSGIEDWIEFSPSEKLHAALLLLSLRHPFEKRPLLGRDTKVTLSFVPAD